MEIKGFHFWTFIFQLANFFVLLFILSRLLYRPLKNFIEKRKEEIAKCIVEAEQIKKDAYSLAKQYEEKLQEIEAHKEELKEQIIRKAEEERKKIIEEAIREGEKIKRKAKELAEREFNHAEKILKKETINLAEKIIYKWLESLSLETFHQLILEKWTRDSSSALKDLSLQLTHQESYHIEVISAFPLGDWQIPIENSLKNSFPGKTILSFSLDPTLKAGLQIKINGYILDFSLKGHLKRIRELMEAEA